MLFRKKPVATEKRILLKNISWAKLEELLAELGSNREAHLTYDRGRLEMMTPLEEHNRCNRLLESLLLVVADEMGDSLVSPGNVLLLQPEIGRAIQPMACYYLENAPAIPPSGKLDVTQVPPPDIAIEIALQESDSPKRLSFYETMGVPEIWQYVTTVGEEVLKGDLKIWALDRGGYRPVQISPAYDFLTIAKVTEFLAESETLGLARALTLLRSWVKTQG
ncbi:Uma2 family endonuclease [Alkalinema pantanalense CENA528]|uniref:Uma2 family endonuclease n=1 Tax=Alkalinema pantanalense TaxID=1620705 RepID=UPI003D6EAC6D